MDIAAETHPQAATKFPLPPADLETLGFRRQQIDRLIALIERHIAEGRYPGCQIALARHGKLALYKSFGNAVTEPRPLAAGDDTLWLLYSNTKVITAVALWALASNSEMVPALAMSLPCSHRAAFASAVTGFVVEVPVRTSVVDAGSIA